MSLEEKQASRSRRRSRAPGAGEETRRPEWTTRPPCFRIGCAPLEVRVRWFVSQGSGRSGREQLGVRARR